MPSHKTAVPKYQCHRASGQARVVICGQHYYLGPHNSKASVFEYDRLIQEWLAAGRPTSACPPPSEENAFTVSQLLLAYIRFADSYYASNQKTQPTFKRPKYRHFARRGDNEVRPN